MQITVAGNKKEVKDDLKLTVRVRAGGNPGVCDRFHQ